MPRGAPQGNDYAKKDESEKKAGLSFSFYLDAYDYEFLQQAVVWDDKEPTKKNVRAKVKEIVRKAINQELQRVFVRAGQEMTRKEK